MVTLENLLVSVTEANISDAPDIYELSLYYSGSTRGWAKEEVENVITSQGYCVIVAKKEEIIVGYAIAQLAWGKMHLLDIAVKEDMRRQGIGSEMLKYLINQAKEWRLPEVYLEARASNTPAVRLYSRFSFKTRFILPKFYEGEDILAMYLPL